MDNNKYESPITLIVDQCVNDLKMSLDKQTSEYVISAVQKLGININEQELIKALKYDRDSYNNGYREGYQRGYLAGQKCVLDKLNKFIEEGSNED